jgi:Glyoxalase superfamily protein
MDAKGIARALCAQLRTLGHEVSQSQALELVARSAGWKDWNAITAQDQPKPKPKPKAVTRGLYCPKCGQKGTVSVAASAFVEQGPYVNQRYSFEGEANHYVCNACDGQFLDWTSAWPELRGVSDLLCLLEKKAGRWQVVLFPMSHVLAELADSGGDHAPDEAAVIARAAQENAAALRLGDEREEEPLRLVEELGAESRERVFVGGPLPYEAILAMRQVLSKEDLDRVVGVPKDGLLL